jgi:hypothetical protein
MMQTPAQNLVAKRNITFTMDDVALSDKKVYCCYQRRPEPLDKVAQYMTNKGP